MPAVFSRSTLEKFEAAAASIPLRQLERTFDAAGIRLGEDPGGDQGKRNVQFRRYVASLDQRDSKHLARLCSALGMLIGEVATSKKAYLLNAAERDGFSFSGGIFRASKNTPDSFSVSTIDALATVDELGRRLTVLADADPKRAIAGAASLIESARAVTKSLKLSAADKAILKNFADVVDRLSESRSRQTPHHARLAAGAAVTFARFLADAYVER